MTMSTSEIPPLLLIDNGDEDEDLHFCGRCRLTFADISEFLSHKKQCKRASEAKTLATDEAAVISLLANQLSSQRSGDDLDQLTLVFKDEFEAIADPGIPKKTTKKKAQTNSSIQTFKSDDQIKIVKDNRLPCSVPGCSFSAPHMKDITRHMRVHTGEKPYECKFCSKAFSRADKVKNHERIHTGEKPFSCALCSYGTNDSGSLKKHMRVHMDERPYKCQICTYRSRDSSQLTVHLRTHTNDRPFVCPHQPCTSSFKTNSDLKRHTKLHICSRCPFKSGLPQVVKTHVETTHSEKLQCSVCDFETESKASLKAHSKSHKSTNDMKCEHCDFSTPSKVILSRHQKKSHSEALITTEPKSRCGKKNLGKGKKLAQPATKKEASKSTFTFSANFNCSICNALFIREDSYKSHMRQHEGKSEDVNEHIEYVIFQN